MFMRLLQVYIKSNSLSDLPFLYTNFIIPEVRNAPGCLYGELIQSDRDPEESISMTLWDTQEHADSYAQSGVFQKLLKEAESYFSDVLEWRVQLSKDLDLESAPMQDEPVIQSRRTRLSESQDGIRHLNGERLYVRILSIRILPGKLEEFAGLYNELIVPRLRSVHGCRYAFLTEGIEERNEVISVTIWDKKEDADQYESDGIFDALKRRVQHTYSELYQWKLTADKPLEQTVDAGEEMSTANYRVIAGQSFN